MSDYVQPYGEADPNAPYKDRNTGAGQPGSKVPALAIEMPQREIRTVIVAAGLAPDRTDPTQLNAAIDQKIALATAGGENPLEDLLTLLRARLRIYPEILTTDGRFNLTIPSTGNVRIPSGIEILHRGVHITTTSEQNFATAPNKTYHLRHRWTGGSPGWALVDVADSGYNPSALVESNVAFDSGYDDMISHRVETSAGNVATVTALANKSELDGSHQFEQSLTFNATAGWSTLSGTGSTLNLARTPRVAFPTVSLVRAQQNNPSDGVNLDPAVQGNLQTIGVRALSVVTRYALPNLQYSYDDSMNNDGFIAGNWIYIV